MSAVLAHSGRICARTVLVLCSYCAIGALMAQNGRKIGANRRTMGTKWAHLGCAPTVLHTPLRYLAHVGRTSSAVAAQDGRTGAHLGRIWDAFGARTLKVNFAGFGSTTSTPEIAGSIPVTDCCRGVWKVDLCASTG